MSRPSKGARLYLLKRKGREPVWCIRDEGAVFTSTGTGDRREAESALARYLATRGMPSGPSGPEAMTVGQALSLYGEGHAAHVVDPARIGFAIDALDRFWGDLPVAAVKGETCRRYALSRVVVARDGSTRPVAPGTVRRELGALQAALNYCVREGHLTTSPKVTLPSKPAPKERWLTRTEMAWLLVASRKLRIDGRHLARFILAGRYTGTRKSATLALRIDEASITDGWIDTARGVLYRQGAGATRTKKRQPSVRLPPPFLAHVRRWKANGSRFVVETCEGNRVADIKNGWSNACRIAETLAAKKGVAIDLSEATPHVLRHTAITWAMQLGAEPWDVSGFFGVSLQTIESVYGHHHPDHQASAVQAMGAKVSVARRGNRAGPGAKPER